MNEQVLPTTCSPTITSRRGKRRFVPPLPFFLLVLLVILPIKDAAAFPNVGGIIPRTRITRQNYLMREQSPYYSCATTSLFGIADWRSSSLETNRTCLILPFALEEALMIPGQSTTVVFNEGRYFDLLEEATSNHNHVLALTIMGPDASYDIMPLCEITSYQLEAAYRGKVTATATLQCVGRAQLLELKHIQPTMKGTCRELRDEKNMTADTLQSCNEVIQDMEQLLANMPNQKAMYEQHFWTALTALGYQPTSLLTRDPSATNSYKEVQAASWATMAVLQNAKDRYHGMAYTSVLERLQWGRRVLLQQSVISPTADTMDTTMNGSTTSSPSPPPNSNEGAFE